jgi:pyruvate dehydrogenase E2 component (dihydrolipoamide acetyltransferase)
MFEFKLPDLGEGIHEGQVVGVLVQEGDTVAEYQPLLEIETDKAAVEIPSPKAGRIAKLFVQPGQIVKVGDVMVVIDESGAGKAAPTAEVAAPAEKAEKQVVAAAESGAMAVPPPTVVATAAPLPVRRDGPVAAAPVVRKLARELGVDIQRGPRRATRPSRISGG